MREQHVIAILRIIARRQFENRAECFFAFGLACWRAVLVQ
jgi:hypothetical protein